MIVDEELLTVFEGRCGHRWIGSMTGSYACPVCGDHDGDHHLIGAEELPVQLDDWGSGEKGMSNGTQSVR
jgi:hypothetical protein